MTGRHALRRTHPLLHAAVAATLILSTGSALMASPASAAPDRGAPASGRLATAFDSAAARYDVPRDLLVALGHAETRLDDHGGAPSASGGHGIMHLVSNPELHTLDEAAALTGLSPGVLGADSTANVTGAAAVLRSYADQAGLTPAERQDIDNWYGTVARYGGATTPSVARL